MLMSRSTILLAALLQSAAAVKSSSHAPLLKHNARNHLPTTPRFLGSGDNSGGDGDDGSDEAEDEEVSMDVSFLKKYSVMYENCFADNRQVTFKLCESDHDCKHDKCSDGGEYVVDFDFFLDAFTELQLGAKEYACEMMRESCIADGWSEDAEDFDVCYQYKGSIAGANYTYCLSNTNEDWKLQSYLDCTEVELSDGSIKYAAPYCDSSDAYSIYMGLYDDADCSEKTEFGDDDDDGVQELLENESFAFMPFMKELEGGKAVIEEECGKCREHGLDQDQNGGDDYDDEDEVIQQCEELYLSTTDKCETKYMNSDAHTIDQSGCAGIITMQKAESHFTSRSSNSYVVKKSRAPELIGWTALGLAATFAVVGGGYYAYKKSNNAPMETGDVKTTPLV
mmetsp:Transcript_13552/g.20002  ORF Transcript_13552/g.20002 Transcript_13552/m.20002 type:complete len:395 (-) Transcript_13552:133-1317(-)|eukprot:CAMPEP_0194233100 /NCGR_PEP_ID=MMETSP0158-20130606/1192_1 /TAXON_ID=33649 /ORGANISM="Thalassionema nitzschioides, Strain L26-B" /LENGTH=394 /DNA_ID=CAMNT_0038965939 /DNA_START=51 /DNA_END=1235 /DNA_ORIENTATION=+